MTADRAFPQSFCALHQALRQAEWRYPHRRVTGRDLRAGVPRMPIFDPHPMRSGRVSRAWLRYYAANRILIALRARSRRMRCDALR